MNERRSCSACLPCGVRELSALNLGASASAFLSFWSRSLFVVGVVLCIIGCFADSLASTYKVLAATYLLPSVLTSKNASRLFQLSPECKIDPAEIHRFIPTALTTQKPV
jgi:hypothetical protein